MSEERRPAEVRILGGSPTAAEIAAVTAVLSAAVDQLAAEERTEEQPPSTWERTRRAIRPPLAGTWRHPAG